MDEKIIREISDVVTAEVIEKVRGNLSEMKPELIKEICQTVLSQVDDIYSKRIRTLEESVAYLEKQAYPTN